MTPPALLRATAAALVALACVPAGTRSAPKDDPLFPPGGPKVPLGLVPIMWPKDNPYTPEKAELGWLLYFDKRLSVDGTVSCASCHNPQFAFTDGQPFSRGIRNQLGGRSAPTVINRAYSLEQFWDGRAKTLEEQAKGPIANPIEMGHAHDLCEKCIGGIPGYRTRFRDVFGPGDVTIDNIAKAIATFERTVLSGNSAYDRFKAGDANALSESQKNGMKVFFSDHARCDSCHEGVNFTNGKYANVGIGMDKPMPDLGRFVVTQKEEDRGAFKTPTLRDVARTAPYMHDGSLKTLEDVVEHYNKGGIKNPWLHQDVRELKLSDQDKKDLVEFLKSLNGEGWQHIKPPTKFPE
ncbi:MAG TPA: cytochrome c peroxidase [Gemmataceae bacterium]|nr:cytochrome c peroxidase [Gemmataceae bacterium]